MNTDWVAVSIRARAMARSRTGAGACRQIAEQENLAAAVQELDTSSYSEFLKAGSGLEDAQRATSEAVLWQLRVLAGWLPAGRTRLLRAAAAAFERDNILNLARHLDGAPERPEYTLGTLVRAWPRLRAATTREELDTALRRSPWGDPGEGGPSNLADVLRIGWIRELAAAAPQAKPWAVTAATLTAGRIVLVDHNPPSPRLRHLIKPLIGEAWADTNDLAGLRAALPVPSRKALDGVEQPQDLWQAEARAVAEAEDDAFALLRRPRPGRSVVLGAIVLLAIDAWRLRAALAVADAGGGRNEVLDAVA